MINSKYYKRISDCWKRKDNPIYKKQKIIQETKRICDENKGLSELEVVDILIADFKGQISNNTFIEFISIIVSVLTLILGYTLSDTYWIYIPIVIILILLFFTIYCLRYLYSEGFAVKVLEDYREEILKKEKKRKKKKK